MKKQNLEQRVADLEKRMDGIVANIYVPAREQEWERIVAVSRETVEKMGYKGLYTKTPKVKK